VALEYAGQVQQFESPQWIDSARDVNRTLMLRRQAVIGACRP